MNNRVITTPHKVLAINLDPSNFGSFAEIGAGQETSAFFFRVGGASATVAKAVSAYDKQVSDHQYGKTPDGRYVSVARVQDMLEKEFYELQTTIGDDRSKQKLFSFANTVATASFSRPDAVAHGWMGIRFQLSEQHEPTTIVLHFYLKQDKPIRQQKAVGIAGVNLIYGVFYYLPLNAEFFIESLTDALDDRIQFDYIFIDGQQTEQYDMNELNIHLVRASVADLVYFDANHTVRQMGEELYRQKIVLHNEIFSPITKRERSLVNLAREQIMEAQPEQDDIRYILHLDGLNKSSDLKDNVGRIKLLNSLGHPVILTKEYCSTSVLHSLINLVKSDLSLVCRSDKLADLYQQLLEAKEQARGLCQNLHCYCYQAQSNTIKLPYDVSLFNRYNELSFDHDLLDEEGSEQLLNKIKDHQIDINDVLDPDVVEVICELNLWNLRDNLRK